MRKTKGGLFVDDAQQEPLPVGGVRLDWDTDFSRGVVTEVITRGPLEPGGKNQEPVTVNMNIADILELAATLQLQSLAYMRELAAHGQKLVKQS